jgi:hypothetical protein
MNPLCDGCHTAEERGAPFYWKSAVFNVILNELRINNDHDPDFGLKEVFYTLITGNPTLAAAISSTTGDDQGEYRVFANVGIDWFFLKYLQFQIYLIQA